MRRSSTPSSTNADGQLLYVNAGHNPPYLIRSMDARDTTPDIQELSVGGTVLGLFPEMDYQEGDLYTCAQVTCWWHSPTA